MQQTTQQPSLKTLAARVLARSERNEVRNNGATQRQKPCNHPSFERRPFVAAATVSAAYPSDGLRTWWWIYRNGSPLCQMLTLGGMTREEALRSAKARWPVDQIDVPKFDLDGRGPQINLSGEILCS